ncbi:ABC transporter permease [Methanosarcina sp. Z-7115]|uniref:ABC transporter permease n=1 Tax=Methanosarcina baikalica TaxID=3073890 RepID=A0ABU2CXQ3_9EURY|nr:ABC transporter permease [Methanosarcina sp. Z-7115]MDR7664516.1 ABC transporter permease [Methanosarcina sp. Z-7115]
MDNAFADRLRKENLLMPEAYGGEFTKKVFQRKDMLFALIALLLFSGTALFAPLISPYDPNAIDLGNKNLSPSGEHLLGTDYLGRDLLSRILIGARTSLSIAFGVVLISLLIGTALGCVAGYYGGIVDESISRVIDIFLSFPGIIFALAIMGVLGSGVFNLIFALSIVQWAKYARVMRGQVLSLKKQEFVLSAVTSGADDFHIILKHIVPNAIAPLLVLATIDFGHVILSIATLSFLGIGLPADVPEWGAMLSAGKEFMRTAPNQTIFPGLAITSFVVIFSILGDGMRDILDPNHEGGEIY